MLTGKEEEHSELHAAEHRQEALPDDEREQQVDEHVERLAGAAGVQWVDLPARSRSTCGSVSYRLQAGQRAGRAEALIRCGSTKRTNALKLALDALMALIMRHETL